MKNFKKVLALVLAVVMLLSFATVASAKTVKSDFYKDADEIDYTEAVDVLGKIGVLNGYPDDTFKPNGTITRAEAAKIIAIFDNQSADISKLYASANPFTDCVGNWAESFIAYGVKTGIIAGRNATTFDPNGKVTGVEFLKMALVVLGYNAKTEGLEGKNWDVNTLALAKRVGLTDSLGAKFEYANPLKRQEAAVIMLDALRADVVEYGSKLGLNNLTEYNWGTQTFNGQVYWTVAGAVSTGDKLGSKWGLTESYDYDAFRRPFRTWLLKGNEIGRYMFPVAAEYTTKFDACDLLVDLGVPTSSSASRKVTGAWINGEWQGNKAYDLLGTLAHDTVSWTHNCPMTDKTAGAQGTLTQVFAISSNDLAKAIYGDNTDVTAGYVVTEIDTFLAQVTKATSKTFNKEGHIVVGTEATLEVYGNSVCGREISENDTFTATTTESLKKGDFVLVRLSTHATSGNDYVVVEMATPETKVASFDGLRTIDYVDQTRIAGEFVPNAEHFHLGEDIWANRSYGTKLFFFDTYGNVIGMALPSAGASEYLTITKMWYEHVTGDPSIHADVTTLDGKTTKNVTFKTLNGKTAQQWINGDALAGGTYGNLEYASTHSAWYHQLYTYAIDSNGNYVVNTADYETVSGGASFTKGETEVMEKGTSTVAIGVDNSTKFLIHEKDGSYTAVTGYKSLDSMVVTTALYIDEDGDEYADVVYFCEPTRNNETFYAYFNGITREYILSESGVKYLGYVVYVNGVKTVVYQPETDGRQLAGIDGSDVFQGWVKLTYHNDGDIEYVTLDPDFRTDAKIVALNSQANITAVANGALTYKGSRYDFADDVKVYFVDTDRAVVEAAPSDFELANLAGARAAIWTVYGDITEIYVYGGWNW